MNKFKITNKYLNNIWEYYDAFYFLNKYGNNGTHDLEFCKLRELLQNDKKGLNALTWIKQCYDCYYSDYYEEKDENNPFYYLQCQIDKIEEKL